MSLSSRLHRKGEPFIFSPESEKKIQDLRSKYPKGCEQSAVIPVLDVAQRQNGGWLSKEAIEAVAESLAMPSLKVWEIASFYTMFSLEPIGTHLVQVCRTTPCWLRGSDEVLRACQDKLGVNLGETSSDGQFTLVEVECLGACVNAPMVQINDDYYEDLSYESMGSVIDKLVLGSKVKTGPQVARQTSAPVGGLTCLSSHLKLHSGKESSPAKGQLSGVKPPETQDDLEREQRGKPAIKTPPNLLEKGSPGDKALSGQSQESVRMSKTTGDDLDTKGSMQGGRSVSQKSLKGEPKASEKNPKNTVEKKTTSLPEGEV